MAEENAKVVEETEEEMILIEYTQYPKVNKYGKLRRFCNSCYSIDCGQKGNYEVCTGSWHTEDIYIYSTKNKALEELNRDRDIILNYDEAIYKFDRIINNYPSLKNIDYVYYMRALCYYEQISHESLDGKNN